RTERSVSELESSMIPIIHKFQENRTLDVLFADLDQNRDLEIDFQEFIVLIAMMMSACHDLFSPDHNH
ncbi:unnamed protein product, partial [Coregonus sp. 'balchen']